MHTKSAAKNCQAYVDEMAVVLRRQEWLVAVKDSDEKKLETLQQATAIPASGEDSASVAGSRDSGAVARAGPCAGYQNLKTLNDFSGKGIKFRACTSKDQLKKVQESMGPAKKLYQTLLASCKASVSELRSAKQRAAAAANKRKRIREEENLNKAKPKRGRGKATVNPAQAASGLAHHSIFELESSDCATIPSATTWQSDWLLDKAFVISNIDQIVDEESARKSVKTLLSDFAKAFNESSLKARAT